MKQIRGKKALITGAASGIGRAIALRLAAEGADLFLVDIDQKNLLTVAAEARRSGVEVITAQCDVSQSAAISDCVRSCLGAWAGLDILVNNAGIGYYGPTLKMSGEQWDRLLAVNLHAPIQFTRELLPTLLNRHEAHIVNVASIFGLVVHHRWNAYCTSKFALLGFTEALRAEFSRENLGVTALCPGFVDTRFFESIACGHPNREIPRPPRWLLTTPEKIARKAIRAIYRNKPMVLATPAAYALYYTKRLAPWLFDLAYRLDRRRTLQKKAARLAAAQQNAPHRGQA